jgi:PIN domain nuclease of toxin-antitoxin system
MGRQANQYGLEIGDRKCRALVANMDAPAARVKLNWSVIENRPTVGNGIIASCEKACEAGSV